MKRLKELADRENEEIYKSCVSEEEGKELATSDIFFTTKYWRTALPDFWRRGEALCAAVPKLSAKTITRAPIAVPKLGKPTRVFWIPQGHMSL